MLSTPPASPVVTACVKTGALSPRSDVLAGADGSDSGGSDCGEDERQRVVPRSLGDVAVVAASFAAKAREARLATVGAAKARVEARAVECRAAVDTRRLAEEQRTERCLIEEDARTRCVERLAQAAEVLVVERNRTERAALQARAFREVIIMCGELEKQRSRTRAGTGMMNVLQLALASFIGAVSAKAAQPPRRHGAKATRLVRPQLVLAILFVASVRQLWLSENSRRFLVWSTELGPLFGSVLRKMLHGALETISLAPSALCEHDSGASGVTKSADSQPCPSEGLWRGPEVEPHLWCSKVGPDGRTFWHHLSLGPPPWEKKERSQD
mmetsp:Transcript_47324/g.120047  ORF Transcript_47324/g.120047 Transcript_47324/m.120047 type:complete len:327 (-) Transcript_47324:407-1387(-)